MYITFEVFVYTYLVTDTLLIGSPSMWMISTNAHKFMQDRAAFLTFCREITSDNIQVVDIHIYNNI